MSQENKMATLSFIIVIVALLAAMSNEKFFDSIRIERINGKKDATMQPKKLSSGEFPPKNRIDDFQMRDKKKQEKNAESFPENKEYDLEKEKAGNGASNGKKKIYEMKQSALKIWRQKQKNENRRFRIAEMPKENNRQRTYRKEVMPYIYKNGMPERRLSPDAEVVNTESQQNVLQKKQYTFDQEIQQDQDSLVIHLVLKKETDLTQNDWKYGVIFSQKIPEGYHFVKKEHGSGWSSVEDGKLKFLALPSEDLNEVNVGLVFVQNQLITAPTVIQPASCCFQNDNGEKILCISL